MLVLLVVLGTLLLVRSRSTAQDGTAVGASSTTATSTAPAPQTTSALPPLPRSRAPSPTTPPPTSPPSSAATTTAARASPADVGAITALSQQLIDALNSGDAQQVEAVTCGKLRTQAEQGAEPPEKTISYDRTEDITVDGDAGTAQVYASDDDSEPTPATMEVQRVDGTWKACNLR
ncbi:MAG: hypothetical protein ABI181_05575 [Mycobacteriaceae bacterium]